MNANEFNGLLVNAAEAISSGSECTVGGNVYVGDQNDNAANHVDNHVKDGGSAAHGHVLHLERGHGLQGLHGDERADGHHVDVHAHRQHYNDEDDSDSSCSSGSSLHDAITMTSGSAQNMQQTNGNAG